MLTERNVLFVRCLYLQTVVEGRKRQHLDQAQMHMGVVSGETEVDHIRDSHRYGYDSELMPLAASLPLNADEEEDPYSDLREMQEFAFITLSNLILSQGPRVQDRERRIGVYSPIVRQTRSFVLCWLHSYTVACENESMKRTWRVYTAEDIFWTNRRNSLLPKHSSGSAE